MTKKKSVLVFLLLVTGTFLFAAKGLIVAQKYNTGKASEQVTVTWYITETQCKLKMQFGDKEIQPINSFFLPDIQNHKFYTYSDGVTATGGTKTYYTIPVSSIQDNANAASLERTGVTKIISGYNCEKMLVSAAGKQTEMWVTKDFPAQMFRFAAFFKSSTELKGLASNHTPGVPLVSVTKGNTGQVVNSYELISVTTAEIPESEFAVPSEYKSAEEVSKQKK